MLLPILLYGNSLLAVMLPEACTIYKASQLRWHD